jgi:hypothetical protein
VPCYLSVPYTKWCFIIYISMEGVSNFNFKISFPQRRINLGFKAIYFIHNFYRISITNACQSGLGDLSVLYLQQNSGQSENRQSNKVYVTVIYSKFFIIIAVEIGSHLY